MAGPSPPFFRFLQLCEKSDTGCWEWKGSSSRNGYGQFKAFGKMVAAHRFSYELHKGPIPEGAHILHACDNKRCVNPDHLRAGTHAENMADAGARGLMPRGRNHHAFGKRNPRPSQAHRVRVLGQEYPSKKEAERTLGLGAGTVSYWVRNKPEKAQIISKGIQ